MTAVVCVLHGEADVVGEECVNSCTRPEPARRLADSLTERNPRPPIAAEVDEDEHRERPEGGKGRSLRIADHLFGDSEDDGHNDRRSRGALQRRQARIREPGPGDSDRAKLNFTFSASDPTKISSVSTTPAERSRLSGTASTQPMPGRDRLQRPGQPNPEASRGKRRWQLRQAEQGQRRQPRPRRRRLRHKRPTERTAKRQRFRPDARERRLQRQPQGFGDL
jgi:hypothetical protein